jgi:hypothetical protein
MSGDENLDHLIKHSEYPKSIKTQLISILVLLAVTGTTVLAQAFYPDDPVVVFYPKYMGNEYRLVYLLKDNIAVSVERVVESNSRDDLLKIEVTGKDG